MTVNDMIALLEEQRDAGRGQALVLCLNYEQVKCNPHRVYVDEDGDVILADD